jgi:hypothetical protein
VKPSAHLAAWATVVLDWFHIAMHFEYVLRATAGLGAGTIDAHLGAVARRDMERAKWCLWHGGWKRFLVKLVTTFRWSEAKRIRGAAGIETLQQPLRDLVDYLEVNTAMLVNYGAHRPREPIWPRSSRRRAKDGNVRLKAESASKSMA